MTSPLLRILLAMIVGLWSPLCCCQAAAIGGELTGRAGVCNLADDRMESPSSKVKASCCSHCQDESSARESSDDSPQSDDDQGSNDQAPCGDCPACKGMFGIGRVNDGDLALRTLTSAVAVLFMAVPVEPTPSLPFVGGEPPPRPPDHLVRNAGGRVLLRWRCALIV